MYIHRATKKTKTGKVYKSVLLQHSYREDGKVKHKTIQNLSQWKEAEIESLAKMLKGKRGYDINDFKTTEGKGVGGLMIFKEIAKKTGVLKMLGNREEAKFALLLIIGRIMAQGSRRSLCEWVKNQELKKSLGIEEEAVKTETLYKTLDWLADKQGQMEKKLFSNREITGQSLYLYDVTSSYLEGERNDLAEWGYNRDKKKGKKQLVIGLLTDGQGIPVSIEVFRGNTGDTQTVDSQIKKCVEGFGLKKITFVGDKGMIKSAQKEQLGEEDYRFISTITRPQIQGLINRGVIQLELFEDQLVEIEDGTDRYVLRRNPVRQKEIGDSRDAKLVSIETYKDSLNEYLSAHPKASAEVALKKMATYLEKVKLKTWCTCEMDKDKAQIQLQIDQEKKKEISQLDGCYVIHTDVSKEEVSKEDIHSHYKELAQVETAFRTLKTGCLEIRPLFVRKDSRTRGHVFVSMLAYILVQHFWRSVQKLGHTRDYALDLVRSIQTVHVELGDKKVIRIPTLGEDKQALLAALDISLPETL